ncbi:MAG: tetratricopeptide repeat protein [Saprospiraceae bacterium]|nr:tetratricopeptide repeat protein [Saprospiraceae bacterium]
MITRISMLLILLSSTTFLIAQDATAETAASLYNDGLANLKAKEYSAAYEKLMKAIEVANPEEDAKVLSLAKANGSISCYYLGNALLKEKNYDEALAKFEKGLELNPKSYTCQYGIGSALDKKGMLVEAVKNYLKAADVATDAGKADRAEKYVSRAENKVGVTYGKKNYDDAITVGELVLAVQESANVSYYMAKALIKKGQASDAIPHAEKAHSLGQSADEGKYIMAYAEALEAAGQKSAAVEAYKKVPAGKYAETAKYKVETL